MATSYGYDPLGNTTSRTRAGGNHTLTWTHTGKPNTITTPAGATTYLYDTTNTVLLRKDPPPPSGYQNIPVLELR